MNVFYKTKYFFGTIYRGLIGRYHNTFAQAPVINKEVENFVIGKSAEGKEIRCYRIKGIGNKGLEEKILFVGGIHGNEVGTVKLAHYIINYFSLVKNFKSTLYVIPCLNPDGYNQALKNPDYAHRGRIGRANSRGVDLNRNFPTPNFQSEGEWGFGVNYSDEKIKIYGGEFGGSESETQALINFIKQENITNLIMLHNAGQDVVYNNGDEVAKNWAEIYQEFTKFKIRTDLNYSGGAAEWAKEKNIHYLTVEGSSRWGSDWRKQKQAIKKIVDVIGNK
ncbi:MAG TPA: M14 family zinc carboxypeptidase [bacterium]|nr:M14 family zinc carboxypeptidase [bacterium]HPL95509.1 M14 family zinc carboxypeptidase [bacterium]